MSIAVMAKVWNIDLPAKEKLVLLAMADNADPYGNNCFPSMSTISQKTSMPLRTVQRAIAALKKQGVLRVMSAANYRRPTVYRIILSGLEAPPVLGPKECPPQLRREVIKAFLMECQYCNRHGDEANGPDGKPWHVDRLIPASRGGNYSPENITLACGSCNRAKGAKMAPTITLSLGAKTAPGGVPYQVLKGCQNEQPLPIYREPSKEPLIEPLSFFERRYRAMKEMTL